MKQKIAIFISVLFLAASNMHAQINEGGTPAGITNNLLSHVSYLTMPSFNLQQIRSEDAMNDQLKGWWRFGHNHEVSLTQQNSGIVMTLPDGGRLWLLGIRSTGALSINLAFKNFNIPAGAKMFVYNPAGTQVLGAFTHANNQQDGEFATELLLGETLILEYYEPPQAAGTGTFELFRITHAYRGVSDYMSRDFLDAGPCQVNVACPSAAPWANEIRSICILVSGGNGFCSAVLVNNVRQDGIPYVLTADHCGSTGFGTWVFRFNWQSPTCTNPVSVPSYNSVSGSIQVASNPSSDFSLVRINTTPPLSYNVFYAGWSNLTTAVSSVTGIHHPSADIKKISFANNPVSAVPWNGAACWQVGPWTTGTTESGSSGSPIFDPNHRVIGQLFGGGSACGLPPSSQIDYYGRFSTSWNSSSLPSKRLRDWLDPDNTCATVLDGFDPNAALLSLDAEVLAVQSPVCNSSNCLSSITPSVLLRNRGTTPLTSVNINWKLDSNPVTTFAWTGNLAANASTTVTLPLISPSAGAHTYTVYTSAPNASADMDVANDTSVSSFTTLSPTNINLPVLQGFQGATFPPVNWSLINPDGSLTWIRHSTIGGFGASFGSAYLINFNYGNGTGESDYLVSPYLNLSSNAAPLRLYFDLAYARRNSAFDDSLIVSYSLDCGFSWTRIYAKGDITLATNGGGLVTSSFTPNSSQWRKDSVSIDFLAGQTDVSIRFENKSAFGNNLWMDNINIIQAPSGIDETAAQNSFVNIFPNPSDGNIQIELGENISGTVNLSLYNSYGQKVFSEILNADKGRILNKNFSTLSKGVYFFRLTGENNSSVTKIVLTD